jgi:hypothetical protein
VEPKKKIQDGISLMGSMSLTPCRFWKEWWTNREIYHRYFQDELICRMMKEKWLGGKVQDLVGNIKDLTELWQTLDMCYNRPEKSVAEAGDAHNQLSLPHGHWTSHHPRVLLAAEVHYYEAKQWG